MLRSAAILRRTCGSLVGAAYGRWIFALGRNLRGHLDSTWRVLRRLQRARLCNSEERLSLDGTAGRGGTIVFSVFVCKCRLEKTAIRCLDMFHDKTKLEGLNLKSPTAPCTQLL